MSNANHYPSNQALDDTANPCGDDKCTDYNDPSLCCLYHADALTRTGAKGDPEKQTCVQTNDVVLSTQGLMEEIQAGVSNWLVDLNARRDKEQIAKLQKELPDNATVLAQTGIIHSPIKLVNDTPEHATVEGYWQNDDLLQARDIRLNVGSHANVFGGIGMLKVQSPDPTQLSIPTVEATPENVRFYGASLIATLDVGQLQPGLLQVASANKMVFMQYTYTDQYVAEFLTQPCGGGGYFVEHHDFPHIHMPLSKTESHGHIILGKPITQVPENGLQDGEANPELGYTKIRYAFTAFRIPYGYALYSPSNTIHGDGTLIGPYGITVANASTPANTVLFYRYDDNDKQYKKLENLVEQ